MQNSFDKIKTKHLKNVKQLKEEVKRTFCRLSAVLDLNVYALQQTVNMSRVDPTFAQQQLGCLQQTCDPEGDSAGSKNEWMNAPKF